MIVRLNAITYIRFCQVRMEAAKSVSQVLNYCKKIQAKIHFQKSTFLDLPRYLGKPKLSNLQNYNAVCKVSNVSSSGSLELQTY